MTARRPANAAEMLDRMRERKVRAIAKELAEHDGHQLGAIPDWAEHREGDYLKRAQALLTIAQR